MPTQYYSLPITLRFRHAQERQRETAHGNFSTGSARRISTHRFANISAKLRVGKIKSRRQFTPRNRRPDRSMAPGVVGSPVGALHDRPSGFPARIGTVSPGLAPGLPKPATGAATRRIATSRRNRSGSSTLRRTPPPNRHSHSRKTGGQITTLRRIINSNLKDPFACQNKPNQRPPVPISYFSTQAFPPPPVNSNPCKPPSPPQT